MPFQTKEMCALINYIFQFDLHLKILLLFFNPRCTKFYGNTRYFARILRFRFKILQMSKPTK
jgi:hypothetical protein